MTSSHYYRNARSVEEACETGSAALRTGSDVRSVRTVAYLIDLSQRLSSFRAEPAVRMLDEQIGPLVTETGSTKREDGQEARSG